MRSCGKEYETTLHYLVRCDIYSIYRLELLNDICALKHSLKKISEENLLTVLLYPAEEFSFKINSEILKWTRKFINKTNIFSGPFFLNFSFFPLAKSLYLNYHIPFIFRILCAEFTLSGICLM